MVALRGYQLLMRSGNVEIQGIPIKSDELIAKSDMDRCEREVCNYGVVCFTSLKDGKMLCCFRKSYPFHP